VSESKAINTLARLRKMMVAESANSRNSESDAKRRDSQNSLTVGKGDDRGFKSLPVTISVKLEKYY
jgi:hypothetical protein